MDLGPLATFSLSKSNVADIFLVYFIDEFCIFKKASAAAANILFHERSMSLETFGDKNSSPQYSGLVAIV